LNQIISSPRIFIAILILIGVIGVAAIWYAYYRREKGLKRAKGPLIRLSLDKEEEASPKVPVSQESATNTPTAALKQRAPAFITLQRRPWVLGDLFRALLIVLSLVVAAGFALILLPQPAIDRMVQDLQSRHGTPQQYRIGLLYLGDTIQNDEFIIRGVVRNISTDSIDQLDAAVRFYAHDGSILQTTIIRMNKESIAPDEIAQFELVYPDYRMEFASYAVEFKLRDGALIPYKDMRANRFPSD
jgi:hypothetical protein